MEKEMTPLDYIQLNGGAGSGRQGTSPKTKEAIKQFNTVWDAMAAKYKK